MLKCFLVFFDLCFVDHSHTLHLLVFIKSLLPSSYFDRARAVSNNTRILHTQQSPRGVWANCLQRDFASCPHSFGKRSTVSSDLTAESVCRILQQEITDDRVRRLKAVGELFNYNFQSGNVANHTIDKQALYDNQAVL